MAPSSAHRARLQASIACLGSLLLFWRTHHAAAIVLVALTAASALLAWITPDRYAPVQRRLDRALHVFLSGFTWVLLALVYFGVFTPLRLFLRDPLRLRAPGALHPLSTTPTRFDHQF